MRRASARRRMLNRAESCAAGLAALPQAARFVRYKNASQDFSRSRLQLEHGWGVVQLVGHLTVNEDGVGSSPTAPAKSPLVRHAK